MKKLHLRYVAAVYPITCKLEEEFETTVSTLKELIHELDNVYGGFSEMFINKKSGKLNLNTMIYYGADGKVPIAVLDVDQQISEGARITFW